MNMHPRDLALIILCCMIWGFAFTAQKVALDELPPILFATLLYGSLALTMFPFLRWHEGQMKMIVATSLMIGALRGVFYFIGIALLGSVSLIAIAAQMEVPFTALLAIMVLGERLSWRRFVGFWLCVVGMVVLSFDPSALEYSVGVVFVLISALIRAVGTILMRHLRDVNLFDLTAWRSVISFPIVLVGTLIFESNQMEAIANASWLAWGGVAYGGLVGNLFAGGAFYYLLHRYEVSLLSTILSLAPVFGVIFGVAFYGDLLTSQIILGGLVVVLGTIVIIERRKPGSDILLSDPNVLKRS